jgi:hypothetical protein
VTEPLYSGVGKLLKKPLNFSEWLTMVKKCWQLSKTAEFSTNSCRNLIFFLLNSSLIVLVSSCQHY